MKIRIRHRTTYNYTQPVSFGQHRIMVRPREGHDAHIESSILEITPGHTIRWMRDVNGNSIAKVDFTEPAAQLTRSIANWCCNTTTPIRSILSWRRAR